ncbi:hypothetical protein WN51_10345 [Melipona quadrifasciata]|uniref:Uncharacterized protein n=1 Tax=Melipona quadrifasciata TaxID=166423 RepID=A0A0M9A716_9HYME|nr:hypothetical protein WN51_10345 [Melipona quadrifasciata]
MSEGVKLGRLNGGTVERKCGCATEPIEKRRTSRESLHANKLDISDLERGTIIEPASNIVENIGPARSSPAPSRGEANQIRIRDTFGTIVAQSLCQEKEMVSNLNLTLRNYPAHVPNQWYRLSIPSPEKGIEAKMNKARAKLEVLIWRDGREGKGWEPLSTMKPLETWNVSRGNSIFKSNSLDTDLSDAKSSANSDSEFGLASSITEIGNKDPRITRIALRCTEEKFKQRRKKTRVIDRILYIIPENVEKNIASSWRGGTKFHISQRKLTREMCREVPQPCRECQGLRIADSWRGRTFWKGEDKTIEPHPRSSNEESTKEEKKPFILSVRVESNTRKNFVSQIQAEQTTDSTGTNINARDLKQIELKPKSNVYLTCPKCKSPPSSFPQAPSIRATSSYLASTNKRSVTQFRK